MQVLGLLIGTIFIWDVSTIDSDDDDMSLDDPMDLEDSDAFALADPH
jgi:hypothetical protein